MGEQLVLRMIHKEREWQNSQVHQDSSASLMVRISISQLPFHIFESPWALATTIDALMHKF